MNLKDGGVSVDRLDDIFLELYLKQHDMPKFYLDDSSHTIPMRRSTSAGIECNVCPSARTRKMFGEIMERKVLYSELPVPAEDDIDITPVEMKKERNPQGCSVRTISGPRARKA